MKGAVNTKKEAKTLLKYFIGAGKSSNVKALDIPLPSFLDGANDWQVTADLPDSREHSAFIKDAGMWPDILCSCPRNRTQFWLNL